ncbi:MAG: ester cyclase [Bacteroidota bacterium]
METKNLNANKKIARQTFEAYEKNDFTALEKITDTAKFKLHLPGQDKPLKYDDAVKFNKQYNVAFPDVKFTIENQIAEGDFVMTRGIYKGTNKGTFQGIPASGKKIKVSAMTLQQIVNGKVVEEWDEFDSLGMMKQIGAIPELESSEKYR